MLLRIRQVIKTHFEITATFVLLASSAAHAHISLNHKLKHAGACAEYLIIRDEAASKVAEKREEVLSAVFDKIEERTEPLRNPDGENPQLLVVDHLNPKKTTQLDLKAGMARLFSRDLMVASITGAREDIKTLGRKWTERRRVYIEKEQQDFKNEREKISNRIEHRDGFAETPYILAYKNLLLAELAKDPAAKEKFTALGLAKQEAFLKNLLIHKTGADIQAFASEFADQVASEGRNLAEKITDDYASGVTQDPDFYLLHDFLVRKFEEFKTELNRRFPVSKDLFTAELENAMLLHAAPNEKVVMSKEGRYSIALPQGQAYVEYEPEIATLVLRLNAPRSEKEKQSRVINGVMAHGAGTNRSNLASFLNLMALAGQSGMQASAYEMSYGGQRGLGLTSIRKYDEIGVYIELLVKHAIDTAVDPELPLVFFGRSMGATAGLMAVEAASRLNYTSRVDLWALTSYSNPKTLGLQTKNVYAQRDRGEIKGVLEDALEHSDEVAGDLQRHLVRTLPEHVSEDRRQLQDTVLFMQGAADEDGTVPGSAPGAVINELLDYRDDYAPFAHLYEFADPLADYKVDGAIPGMVPQSMEATHFLLSARGNMTDKSREAAVPAHIPEKDLPKLRDQHHEVYALQLAMLDYQIDLSPLTSVKRRQELRQKRIKATGHDKQFAYLAWYVEHVVNRSLPENQKTSLDQIVWDDSILANRDFGVPGRIKKIYEFCKTEEVRTLQLLRR